MPFEISGNTGIAAVNLAALPSGTAIQTVNTLYTSRTSYTIGYTSDTPVPGGSITIVPKLSGSKILINVRYLMETDTSWDVMYNILRNGTRINNGGLTGNYSGIGATTVTYGAGSDNNSTLDVLVFSTYDTTPTVAGQSITYTLTGISTGTVTRTSYINRTFGSDGQASYENGTSEITVIEIKG